MHSVPLSSEQASQFQQLQAQLRDRWQAIEHFDRNDYDILVVPSLSFNSEELSKIQGVTHYEERLLFSLIRLRNPQTRLVYVTSQPLPSVIIDYYLHLLPGIPFSHARDRLLLLSTYDSSLKPLTQKILERPRLFERIRQALRPEKSYMICHNATSLESLLSLRLQVPLLAIDPVLLPWGTKAGSRQIFAEARVPHPDGSLLVWNAHDLAKAAADLWQRQPHLKWLLVKLNEGFSGEGNALLDLRSIPFKTSLSQRTNTILSHFPHLCFQAAGESWEHFSHQIGELGAIVETFIEGKPKRSPSVQGYISPTGDVTILSTHDQILGGPKGQLYLGCCFPASSAYRLQLHELGLRIGRSLAAKGVLERFCIDFVANLPSAKAGRPDIETSDWQLQAVEINLRKSGTTYPFMLLKYLTNGRYDSTTGLFHNNEETVAKYYIATENLQKTRYCGLLPNDLMDIIASRSLHFNSNTGTGNVFHLMGTLSEFGKLGVTSIGNSRQQARSIYKRMVQMLDRETQKMPWSPER